MSKENRLSAEDRLRLHVTDPETFQFSFEDADALIEEIDALRSKPVAGVEVKPLVWQKENIDGTVWTGVASMSGQYLVKHNGTDWEAIRGMVVVGKSPTADDAKATAEADYRQRILSTLSLPAQEPVAWGWADKSGIRSVSIFKEEAERWAQSGRLVTLYTYPQPEAVKDGE